MVVHVARKHLGQQQHEEEQGAGQLEVVTTTGAVGLYEEFPHLEMEELPVI
jgi:hypothetical protein